MFQRLQREAGHRLVQADGLAQRNRTLARLFRGAMRARLLALARSCGRRCEEVTAALESVAARLKVVMTTGRSAAPVSREHLESSASSFPALRGGLGGV